MVSFPRKRQSRKRKPLEKNLAPCCAGMPCYATGLKWLYKKEGFRSPCRKPSKRLTEHRTLESTLSGDPQP